MTDVRREVRFCLLCGVPKATPYCTACGADPNGVPADIEDLARRPNWGAFLLPGLWPFWHGRPMIAILWYLVLAAGVTGSSPRRIALGAMLAFGIAGYLFLRGNRIALTRRKYRDLDEFLRVERRWAHWGVCVVGAWIAIALAVIVDVIFATAGTR